MKKCNIIGVVAMALIAMVLPSCQEDDLIGSADGEEITVSFQPNLDIDLTRAISDGGKIDELVIAIYDTKSGQETIQEQTWNKTGENKVSLRLIQGRSYDILFWAQYGANTAYSIEDGVVAVNYDDYLKGSFTKMEELDVFYATSSITVGGGNGGAITLSRPMAQLNFADNTGAMVEGDVTLDLYGIATSVDVFGEKAVGAGSVDKTFTFSGDFPSDKLQGLYSYVASVYLLPTEAAISAKYSISTGKTVEVSDITLEANKRTNVIGALVQEPEDIWDGTKITPPELVSSQYIIDECSDLAWLAQNGHTLSAGRFVVTKDLNMAGKDVASVKIPAGSTIDGGGKTIKNLNITTGGLFGDANNLTVTNLTIDNIKAGGDNVTHVGSLVNTLKGGGSFTGVTVKNATVTTTNGAAGGLVGFSVRENETTLDGGYSVTFDNCQVSGTSVFGSLSEGKIVGLFSGYDNAEVLTINANCLADVTVADYVSWYQEGNEATWIADKNFENYNGWLGAEKYYRGTINYGPDRFIPKWDGTTKVTPLSDGSNHYIWSAFDLANLQGRSISDKPVVFKTDVDLAGDRNKKTNPFAPINSISNLDGRKSDTENYTIHNLYVEVTDWVGGFINEVTGTSTHKNLKFENSSVIVHHVTLPADNNSNQDMGYAGTLTPYVNAAHYTAQNIEVSNSYVFGMGKIGGLVGYVTSETGMFKCDKCSVNNTTVKNIKGKTKEVFYSKKVLFTTVKIEFTAHGEAGGLIGMIQGNSDIDDCHVISCTMDCYKTDDYMEIIPGRHVNQFIGDIRTVNGNKTTIDNCTAIDNKYLQSKDTHKYSGGQTDMVGCAYYLEAKLFGIGISLDPKGSVKIDGVEVLKDLI